MQHDDSYLLDIVIAGRNARRFVEGMTLDEFRFDEIRQHAVVRMMQIIGEAARSLSDAFKQAHPEIPWPDIIGMRNLLVHMYWRVDAIKVWETVHDDLPALIAALTPLIPPADGQE